MLKRIVTRSSLVTKGLLRSYATRMYTDSHEWLQCENGEAIIGISSYAQENLGDVVFVSLPQVGAKVSAREVISEIESVKATSNVYSPVDGTISSVNEVLMSEPSLVNKSPEEKGWLVKVQCTELPKDLMNEDEYKKFLE